MLIHEAIHELVFQNDHNRTSKIPPNLSKQGCNMAYQVVYLMKAYNIPPTLAVNNEQTCVHFIPRAKERTWESKGSKHIQVFRVENKTQIIMVVYSTANGFLLPLQIMFISTTHRYLPPSNEGKDKCMNSSWDFTFSENHWSTLETKKQFVHKILLPYLHAQICHLRLHES